MNADADRRYELPDPELRAYDRGIGTLSVDGELKGYLASVLGTLKFPSRQPWPWFVVVWADGTKEHAFEDYGPAWETVRELNAGCLEHLEPSIETRRRFLGMSFIQSVPGAPRVYDFAWLAPEEAAEKWSELGLIDSDF